jgi:hypothetical protein
VDPRITKLQQKYGLPDELQGRPLSEFVLFENVPMIDTFKDDDINATPEFLQKIVKVNNDRTLDTSDMCPLVLGHTDDEKSEAEQPPIVGWALDYKLNPKFGRVNPRPAVMGSMLIHKSIAQKVREKFPRRSVEVYEDGMIDPIALLGATAPRRALSLLSQRASGETAIALARRNTQPRWRFSADEYESNVDSNIDSNSNPQSIGISEMDEQQIADIVTKAIDASPIGQLARKLMEDEDPNMLCDDGEDMKLEEDEDETQLEETEELVDEPIEGFDSTTTETDEVPAGDELVDVEELEVEVEEAQDEISEIVQELIAATDAEEVKAAFSKLAKAKKRFVAAKNAKASAVTKLSRLKKLKAMASKKAGATKKPDSEKSRMQNNQLKIKLAKMDRELAQLKRREAEAATKLRHKERESELQQKLAEGFEFDLTEEFDDVKDMADSDFAKHLQRIERSYQRTPVGSSPIKLSALTTGRDKDSNENSIKFNPKNEDKMIKLAKQKKAELAKLGKSVTVAQALAEVEAEMSAAG